jgi:hypothetical protein
MTPRDPDLYTSYGLPLTTHAHAPTQAAIAAYRAFVADSLFVPPPSADEVRLVALYCQEYIGSPMFTYPADELRQLRRTIVHVRTVQELADWLWDCRRIGIEPL